MHTFPKNPANPDQDLVLRASAYAIRCHTETNHLYDSYLPYQFHLRMAVKHARDFAYLLPAEVHAIVEAAAWCHDLIEDARETYNDVKTQTNEQVAELVRACTNYGRGRNRAERMPDFVYHELVNTPFAVYVKLCDRLANVQYSQMTGSRMLDMYRKEHPHFREKLDLKPSADSVDYRPMWNFLESFYVAH